MSKPRPQTALVYPGNASRGEEILTAAAAFASGLLPLPVQALIMILETAGPVDEELLLVRAMRAADGLVFHASNPPSPHCPIVGIMRDQGKTIWSVDGDGHRKKLKEPADEEPH